MMKRTVIQKKEIDWESKNRSKLDYQMIFEDPQPPEPEPSTPPAEDKVDMVQLLFEKEQVWREKVKQAKEKAYTEGFEKGSRQALEQARGEIDEKLSNLEHAFAKAHEDWQEQQTYINPGLLNLAFDMAEKILGGPVKKNLLEKDLQKELDNFLQQMNESIKSMLWISEDDEKTARKVISNYKEELPVRIRVSDELNPGEFKLESDQKTVLYKFQVMLEDFRKSLKLPAR